MREAAIKDAMDAAHQFLSDTAQRRAYVNRLMAVLDYNSGMENAREEGERKKASAITLSLLKDKMPLAKIMEWTKLPEKEIRQIAKENGIVI